MLNSGQGTNPSASAENFCVVFNSSLNFRKHIIRDLRRIRKYMSLDLAKQIVVALVSSKLDYCNSLFYIIPEKDIARLQRVQNCLAREVTTAPRFSRSTPVLKRLHRLPVNQPTYLADLLIVPPKCSKYLRSTNSNRFVVPRIKTNTGSRVISMFIWLPDKNMQKWYIIIIIIIFRTCY